MELTEQQQEQVATVMAMMAVSCTLSKIIDLPTEGGTVSRLYDELSREEIMESLSSLLGPIVPTEQLPYALQTAFAALTATSLLSKKLNKTLLQFLKENAPLVQTFRDKAKTVYALEEATANNGTVAVPTEGLFSVPCSDIIN